jgi:hypothetical protein
MSTEPSSTSFCRQQGKRRNLLYHSTIPIEMMYVIMYIILLVDLVGLVNPVYSRNCMLHVEVKEF